MRSLTVMALLLLAGSAHALKCKPVQEVWTPGPAVAPQAFVVVEANFRQTEQLLKTPPHFIDDAGAPVPATVQVTGAQAVLRPARPLKGTATLVLPSGWTAPKAWKVTPATAPAAWTGEPKLIDQDDRDMGKYGPSWSRIVQVPAPGAALVQVTIPQPSGPPAVRHLAVLDGTVHLGTSPCTHGVGELMPAGDHQITLRPVGAAGALGAPKTLTIPGPKPLP